VLDLENKPPEIQEVEVEVEKIVTDTTGIDSLNKDIINLQTQVASRDQAIERISQKYDLIDKTKIKEEEDNLGVKATYGESLPVDAEKGQLHTLTNVYPHELKKFNGNKWIDVDKDGTSAYLTNDYIKHLVDQLARNTQDVDDLSAEEKAAVSNYLTRRDVLGQ
jgi:hypothetical protein